MIFTLPYQAAPPVNALFADQGTLIVLPLPDSGLVGETQEIVLDDDWVTGFGVVRKAGDTYCYLRKRDPELKMKAFLALERLPTSLQIVLLKEYRPWKETSAVNPVMELDDAGKVKMARLQKLLAGEDRKPASASVRSQGVEAPPSLLKSSLRSLLALLFVVFMVVAIVMLLKRFRRGRGVSGRSRLIKVLGVEVISGKQQIMFLELLGEVLVVGVNGDRMTILTTIKDAEKIEELRLLQAEQDHRVRRFGSYLEGFLRKDDDLSVRDNPPSGGTGGSVVQGKAAMLTADAEVETAELPDNYREVVSQIKNRLQNNGERSRRG
ncbi:MAG: flagellar biosynthetic protein FliO [Deltaproteobacteria bacterium]|nr:flagellar biosynthetic protein FliO [Deltaproteobacteria bacterium]